MKLKKINADGILSILLRLLRWDVL